MAARHDEALHVIEGELLAALDFLHRAMKCCHEVEMDVSALDAEAACEHLRNAIAKSRETDWPDAYRRMPRDSSE